jgi:pimeloyl-ACP methyl ester carboxylesterase
MALTRRSPPRRSFPVIRRWGPLVSTIASSAPERTVQVAGLGVHILEEGKGEPLVVLHHSTGNTGWLPLYAKLAESFKVAVPDLPGYGQSERPDWARHPRDMAALTGGILDALELDRAHVVGLGFGGWIAAEYATVAGDRLSSLTLVGAPGIRPREGEIFDQMLVGWDEYVKTGFSSDEAFQKVFGEEVAEEIISLWDFSREMTARLTWRPWMFSSQLPHLLPLVQAPTLVVWGRHDRINPISIGEQYAEKIPNAKLEVLEKAGHRIDLEAPEDLARLVAKHTGK